MEDEVSQSGEDENLNQEVMESLGGDSESQEAESEPNEEKVKDDLPKAAKDRIFREQQRRKKELRAMREEIQGLQAQLMQSRQPQEDFNQGNQFQGGGDPEEERITRAVRLALQQKEMEEQKRKDAERMQQVHQEYAGLQEDLDKAGDEFEDFEDVVKAHDAPYTDSIRDAMLLMPRNMRAKLLYKLGRNKDKLQEISKLHPLKQAQEVVKLGFALAGEGNQSKGLESPRVLGNVKSNPVSSNSAVNEKTSAAEIRARMKAGKWR